MSIECGNVYHIKDNFVPVDESDVAHAGDVPVDEKIVETVEKKTNGKKKYAKEKIREKISKKNVNWNDDFKIPGPKKLKENGTLLIITEKPQAAQKIADQTDARGSGEALWVAWRKKKDPGSHREGI